MIPKHEWFTEQMIRLAMGRVIVAVDADDPDEIERIAKSVRDFVGGFKLGSVVIAAQLLEKARDLFLAAGREDLVFMADPKTAETPESAVRTARIYARWGAQIVTVYAESGFTAMSEAQAATHEINPRTGLYAVGVLSSLAQDDLRLVGTLTPSVWELMKHRIQVAQKAGLPGAVCSAQEVELLREQFADIPLVVPGTRLHAKPGGQKRMARPGEVMAAVRGHRADTYLIGGRELTDFNVQPDPMAGLYAMAVDMCGGMFPEAVPSEVHRPDPETSC